MAQFGRPEATITSTYVVSGDHTSIDETSANDTDKIVGTENQATTYECRLSDVTDPTIHTGHIVRYRICKLNGTSVDTGGNAVLCTVSLYQGSTLIKADTQRTCAGLTTYELTLAEGEADDITDYTDLRIRFKGTDSGGSAAAQRALGISWAEMEFPNANTSPTVALNSPADTSSTSDTTPVLDFTGTDADSNDIRYNVQVDTVDTFNSIDGTEAVDDSYSETNRDATASQYGGYSQEQGQSFNPTVSGKLTAVKFFLNKTGSPTGNASAKLYAHTGTYGSTGVPTGEALATSGTLDVSTLDGTLTLKTFTFSTPYSVTAGTKYCVVLYYTGGDASNKLGFGNDGSSPSHGGNLVYSDDSVNWTADTSDSCFYTYITPPAPLLNKVSGTDAGFANPDNGADTDPFTSGENIQYTVQSALDVDTYYWRVRGIDPSGTNAYGAWASTRSFTIASGRRIFTIT